mgnify:FL=1
MPYDMTSFDDQSLSARLLRTGVWLCIFGATVVFWLAVGLTMLSLLV